MSSKGNNENIDFDVVDNLDLEQNLKNCEFYIQEDEILNDEDKSIPMNNLYINEMTNLVENSEQVNKESNEIENFDKNNETDSGSKESESLKIPHTIFIIPYRDRKEHLNFFNVYMKYILEDWKKNDYEIYFSHQCDNRPFNRGAMKNIGFLVMKDKYPNDYEDITFVFHDIDTLPYKKNLISYSTNNNKINHFYGFKFALGGMFAIKGRDFEKINGFPNIWAWGMEDNESQKRAIRNGLEIIRNEFYESGNKAILQFIDGIKKTILSRNRPLDIYEEYKQDGLNTINKLIYEIMPSGNNQIGQMINISTFSTMFDPNNEKYEDYNIILNKGKIYSKLPKAGNMRSIFNFR